MNKLIYFFLSIFFVLNINTLSASGDDDGKNIGVRAGWQISGIYENGSIPDGYGTNSGFYAGFFKDTKIIPLLKLGTGLEYGQVGLIRDSVNVNTKRILHYIAIPIDLKVKLGPVFALGGASLNFRVADKRTVNEQSVDPPPGLESKVFDIPLFVGLGVKIFFVSIEARYHWGMLNVIGDGNVSNNKSQYFQLGAAVSF